MEEYELKPTLYSMELEIVGAPTRRYMQLARLVETARMLGFTLASEPKEI